MVVPTFAVGDILVCSGRGSMPRLIKLATFSRYSHCALIVRIYVDGKYRLAVMESTTLNPEPCIVQMQRVSGVQFHDPVRYAATYRGKVWRLPILAKLSAAQTERLNSYALGFAIGANYDYNGAFHARPLNFLRWPVVRWFCGLPDLQAVDDELFCSELVCEALQVAEVWPRELKPHLQTPASIARLACKVLRTHGQPVEVSSAAKRWLAGV